MNILNKSILGAAIAAVTSSTMVQAKSNNDFNYVVDRFADIEVLRYQVPGFKELTLNQKLLVYYLTEAAIAGRDILWEQNGKYNLRMRLLLESIYKNYKGDRSSDDFKAFETYLKQVWFGNGVHHHYSMDKFTPGFSSTFFAEALKSVPAGEMPEDIDALTRLIFDPAFMSKKVNQADGVDLIATSATNLYDGVTQKEVEDYYNALKDTADLTPISYGLNTRVAKIDGRIVEQTYKVGGLFSPAIERIVDNLKKAALYAENDSQRQVINTLIAYYESGDLKKFDEYSILWVEDTASQVDFINGFIESYDDPLGMTGNWESIVNFKNIAASHRTEVISSNAQWFESHSPVGRRKKP